MEPSDINSNIYFDFGVEINDKDPTFKVGDQVKV